METKENIETTDKKIETKPVDVLDKHRFFTRLIALTIIGIFIYAFVLPLGIAYAEIATYALIAVLIIITFGINSLDKIADILKAFKGK